MADLTPLDEKIGEVLGLAQAAQDATTKVEKLAEDREIKDVLERMRAEATETRERCEAALDGFEFLTMAEAGELGHWEIVQRMGETLNEGSATELAQWAVEVQRRHFDGVRAASLQLAESEARG